ncbi:MAG: hypothetical protein WDW38_011122 [Sanguina aurantia]
MLSQAACHRLTSASHSRTHTCVASHECSALGHSRQRQQRSSCCASVRADATGALQSSGSSSSRGSDSLLVPQPKPSASSSRARRVEDLKDPAQIGAVGAATTTLPVFTEPGVTLSDYMLLPVEQYFVLDPKTVAFLGGDRFTLFVPRINLLTVWVEPVVEVSVNIQGGPNPTVLLKAENCRIRGSELITSMRLDEKFVLKFQTQLTWATNTEHPRDRGLDAPPPGTGSISAASKLDVWSEVVRPFNSMPRGALQASCNLVMRTLVGSLLPLFVHKLAEDYGRWAVDAEYRRVRALRSGPPPSE